MGIDCIGLATGTIIGFLSGLVPGIHINTVVLLLEELAIPAPIFLGAVVASNVIAEFIPAMLLAAPSEELALSVVPVHRLMQRGLGKRGMLAGLSGAVLGVLSFFALAPAAILIVPLIYMYLGRWMGVVLLLMSIALVLSERSPFVALAMFLGSGALGQVVLSYPQPSSTKLFLLLTGCFGFGTLLVALLSGKSLPPQKPTKNVSERVIPGGLLGSFSGFLVGTFPAISCSQSVALLSPLIKSDEEFVSAVAAAGTSNILFSTITLWVVDKARNGVMASLHHLDLLSFVEFSASFSLAILPAILAAFVVSDILIEFLGQYYKKLVLGTACFLPPRAAYGGGEWGVLVFLTSASLGLLTTCLGVRKTECMGMLILPTIMFYLGL